MKHEYLFDKSKIMVAIPAESLNKNYANYYLLNLYFRKYMSAFGYINTTLSHIIHNCGYIKSNPNSNIFNSFKSILSEYINKEYISLSCNLDELKTNTLFTITILKPEKLFSIDKNYILISVEEFDKIISSSTDCTISNLFLIYAYIKKSFDSVTGLSFPTISNIAKAVDITEVTVVNIINKIIDRNLLYTRKDIYVGNINNSSMSLHPKNVYALSIDYLNDKNVIKALEQVYDNVIISKQRK